MTFDVLEGGRASHDSHIPESRDVGHPAAHLRIPTLIGEPAPARNASAGGPAAARKALRAVSFSARLKSCPDTKPRQGGWSASGGVAGGRLRILLGRRCRRGRRRGVRSRPPAGAWHPGRPNQGRRCAPPLFGTTEVMPLHSTWRGKSQEERAVAPPSAKTGQSHSTRSSAGSVLGQARLWGTRHGSSFEEGKAAGAEARFFLDNFGTTEVVP